MKRIIFLLALICSITASAQTRTYSVDGIAKRFSTALGIPVKASSFYNASSDTAIIFFDPSDTTTIHFKYKGVAKKLAASQIPWDSITGKPSNFATTYLLSNDVKDSIQARVRYVDTASLFANRLKISDTASMLVSRLKISDTASMLANRLKISDTSQILDKTVRTFGNQTGIIGDKSFTNNLTANSFIKSSGTSDQLLQGDGGVQSKADIHSGAFTFDTTGRLLTIPVLGGGSYSVLIPRGTASGAEGITALTSSRTGNLITVFGDNGSSTTFSARDADSASLIRTSDTATMLSNRLKISDTLTMLSNRLKISDTSSMLSNYRRTTTKITNSDLANSTISGVSLGSNLAYLMNGYGISGMGYNGASTQTFRIDTSEISTKANVTGLLVGYATVGSVAAKLNISDTTAMLSNLLRKTDTATMLLPFMQYSDTAFMLSPYARTSNLPDFSAKVNVSDTAAMLSNYRRTTTKITNSDLVNSAITINGSSTSLGGSISVGTVTSVGLTAPTGFTVSNSPITSSGNIGLSFTAGYSLPTTASQALWDIAYNKRIVSASLSTSQLTLTAGDASTVTASVPTFNQNTTGTAASLSAVLSSTLGGAGSVSGILKANGSGVVSAAVAGTDYAPAVAGGYLPLSGGTLTGGLNGTTTVMSGRVTANDFRSTSGTIETFVSYSGGVGAIGTASNHALDLFTNGTSKASISTSGAATFSSSVTAGSLRAGATNTIGWTNHGGFESVTDGNFRLYNEARTVNGNLTLGAITASSSVTASSFVKSGGTSAQYLMADGSVTTAGTATSGTYTPTITGVSNVASSTSNQAQYMRVGNVVTVSGYIEVDPTSGNTPTEFRLSLPVSTSWSMGANKAGGVMAGLDGDAVGTITADVATGTVDFRYTSSPSGSNMGISFTFTYLIE